MPVETLFPDQTYEDVPVPDQKARLRECLDRLNPDAVAVAGYSEPVMRAAAQWAKTHQRHSILLLVTSGADRKRYWLKEQLKGRLVRRLFDAIFLGGERHRVYAERPRLPGRPHLEDAETWRTMSTLPPGRRPPGNRRRSATSWACLQRHFLFVGRMAPVKNLSMLLAAYGRYRARGGTWGLVLVGGGQEEDQLRARVALQATPEVHWAGVKSYDDLPAYYGLASALVLPSLSEPWGVVANEAAACGLPLLVSSRCGCVPELVQRGVNGFVFDPLDPEELAAHMLALAADPDRARQMGEYSRRSSAPTRPRRGRPRSAIAWPPCRQRRPDAAAFQGCFSKNAPSSSNEMSGFVSTRMLSMISLPSNSRISAALSSSSSRQAMRRPPTMPPAFIFPDAVIRLTAVATSCRSFGTASPTIKSRASASTRNSITVTSSMPVV